MEDIEQILDKQQWLAKDKFDFNRSKNGCEVGVNIFNRYKFDVFTVFEGLIVQLDNSTLCTIYDYFERARLRNVLRKHFLKIEEPRNVTELLVHRYIDLLLSERSHSCSDISDIRSEVKWLARSLPELNSEHLISELETCGVSIRQG
ncbi:hypothetical protein [Vibrio sp. dhg]|jgi:hypothetical protein|uniref:hypothetical protein n=1 Tax=Vibrio sp. dhg TaxID=2163016 RepID=UPI000E544AD8|nr:hypothetical protein [Vibrio sp. dhg]AXT74210.1 hypothetical protein DBX26_24875 [Vibrio sp. dhg]